MPTIRDSRPTRTVRRSRRVLLAMTLAGSLALAACGDDGDTAAPASSGDAMATTTAAMKADSMKADSMTDAMPFGPACGSVPATGAGSFAGMAADPAATAASNNPVLSTLVTAVKAAGLADTLNGPGPFTIFAPSNDAFARVDKAALDKLLADPTGALTKVLTYHVVPGMKLDAEQLAAKGMAPTVNGGSLKITRDGDTLMVNGAKVICGNVETANAKVFIVDSVLLPS